MVAGKFTSPASGRELKKKARSPSRGQLPLKLSLVKSRPIDLHRGDSSHQLSISQTDGMTFDGGLWFFGRSEKELAEARIAPVVCQLCLEGREEALPGSYFRMPWMRPKGRMAFEQGQEIFYNVQESDQVVAYRRSGEMMWERCVGDIETTEIHYSGYTEEEKKHHSKQNAVTVDNRDGSLWILKSEPFCPMLLTRVSPELDVLLERHVLGNDNSYEAHVEDGRGIGSDNLHVQDISHEPNTANIWLLCGEPGMQFIIRYDSVSRRAEIQEIDSIHNAKGLAIDSAGQTVYIIESHEDNASSPSYPTLHEFAYGCSQSFGVEDLYDMELYPGYSI